MTPQHDTCDPATPAGVNAWYDYVTTRESDATTPPWSDLARQLTGSPAKVPTLLDLARCYATFFRRSRMSPQFAEAAALLSRAATQLRAPDGADRPAPGWSTNLGRTQPRVGVVVPATKKTHEQLPVYPAEALRNHSHGLVLVDVVIDKKGNVKDPRVVGSIPALNKAALDAVRRWRFEPALVGGVPADVVRLLPLAFSPYGSTTAAADRIDLARFLYAQGAWTEAAQVLDDAAASMRQEIAAAATDPDETDVDKLRGVTYDGRSKDIHPPVLVRQVEPRYTNLAMQAKLMGDVELRAVISVKGTVTTVMVARSIDPQGLDLEAVKAAKQWTFKPAIGPDGTPVPCVVTLILSFRLH